MSDGLPGDEAPNELLPQTQVAPCTVCGELTTDGVCNACAAPPREIWCIERQVTPLAWLPYHGSSFTSRQSAEAGMRAMMSWLPTQAADTYRVVRYVPAPVDAG